MNLFERYLSIWVGLCIFVGIGLGQIFPDFMQSIAKLEIEKVNIPVGFLIWVMIIPMLMKINFLSVSEIRHHKRGIIVTLFVNWLVKPFSMTFFAWFFIKNMFFNYLPNENIDSYIAGLILLAAAPCTAMVFVWSRLTKGDPLFTLSQVALNDLIMVFAFAPLVAFLLGVSSISVPWGTLIISVLIYIVVPVIISQLIRRILLLKGNHAFNSVLNKISLYSMLSLLLTLILLFSFQGKKIVEEPLIIGMLSIPIIIQVLFNAFLAYYLNRQCGEKHNIACPSALIGASNFFELAVAAAISLYGFNSGAALATVVGVLIEVPLMLWIVKIVNSTKVWYEQ